MPGSDELKNVIRVSHVSLKADTGDAVEVFLSTEAREIGPGETQVVTVEYDLSDEKIAVVAGAVAQLYDAETDGVPPASAQITSAEYYYWGCRLTVYSALSDTYRIRVSGLYIRKVGSQTVERTNEASKKIFGPREFTIENQLIQSPELAEAIARELIDSYSVYKKDTEIEWPGNPSVELQDDIEVPIYHDFSTGVSTTGRFKIYRNQIQFDGSLSMITSGRRVDSGTEIVEPAILIQDTDGASQMHQDTDGASDRWQDGDLS